MEEPVEGEGLEGGQPGPSGQVPRQPAQPHGAMDAT